MNRRRYHWIGFTFSLEMGGALSYTIGVGQYWTAALVTILNDCPATTLAPLVYFWLIDIWYIIAGASPCLLSALYTSYHLLLAYHGCPRMLAMQDLLPAVFV